jgi:thioredoxin-dependent peroxiredoxin
MIRKMSVPLMVILLGISSMASAKITLKEGEIAPNFALKGNDGMVHKLSSFRGQYVVLYFYPKDETPGCTTEACSFRDDLSTITKQGAKVIGVSVQDVASHKDFTKKYGLNFLLLADPHKKVVKMYGVYNAKWQMANRVTFIIGPKGRIVKIYPEVDPKVHAEQVIAELKSLGNKKD